MKWGIFLVLFILAMMSAGCIVSGVTPVDLSTVTDVEGGVGSDWWDYRYTFSAPPAAAGQVMLFAFIDGATSHYVIGLGYVMPHSTEGYWYTDVNYVGDLGPNAYDLTKYHVWALEAPENPPVAGDYLIQPAASFVSYWPDRNALEIYWVGYPYDGTPEIPFGSVLEVEYRYGDGEEPYFKRACLYEDMTEEGAPVTVARCAFYAPQPFGSMAAYPESYQVRLVERGIPN